MIFRPLNLNRVLLWCSVFRREGTGNEDSFLISGCAGPRLNAGKVTAQSPAVTVPFWEPRFFQGTTLQTGERPTEGCDIFSAGTSELRGCAQTDDVDGEPFVRNGDFIDGCAGVHSLAVLGASYVGGDDAEGRADGDSGAPLLASLAGAALSAQGRADGDSSGALVVRATLAGAAQSAGARFVRACGGEHSSVRAGFW